MYRRDRWYAQRRDAGEMLRNVLRPNILVWTGIVVSVATMLFSSWLSVLPLVLLALALSIMASEGKGINYRLLAFLLGLVSFLVAVFVFATIPPLYLSWIAFFGFLLVLSARNTKILVVYIILFFVILPLLVAFREYLTVSTYNIVRVGSPEELKTLFNNPGSVVLVGHAMADAVAHTQLSPNERIAEWEEVVINGTLYWIFAVTPLNTIAQNYVSKLILVDVQTGETKAIPVHMSVGSGLWLTNSIELRSFLLSSQPIGNTYPFIHGGKPYFAACVNRLANLGLSEYPGEVYVYDQDGNLRRIPQFSGDMSMPENYDWEYLDWYVGKWLYYLSSLSPVSHSFFSRGFLWIPASQYSQDLLNMTLLLPGRSGDTVRVYFGISPNNPNSIVSIIIANNTGVYYYDVKTLGIYSPYYVQSLVQAKLPAISGGHLYSKYAQLVYSNGYLWVIPIYAQTHVVSLWGLALVNATSPSEMSIYQYSPSYGSYKDFLAMALSLGTGQISRPTCEVVAGNVTRLLQFVYKGDTYLVLEVNGRLLYATPDIGIQEFTRLLTVKTGDQVKLCVSDDRIVQVFKP
jgi:hypothetical protein